jgi:hypothetical protein
MVLPYGSFSGIGRIVVARYGASWASESETVGRFASPEITLKRYIEGLRKGDLSVVGECFDPPDRGFYLPGPLKIDKYRIQKRIVFGSKDVRDWKGIIPSAREGDIELQVEEFIDGTPTMFSYWFRKVVSGMEDLRA